MKIELDREKIEAFCKKWHIVEFSLFGSVLRDDFGPESDVDVLVTFHPDHKPNLSEYLRATEELSALVGRNVDLVMRKAVEEGRNPRRKDQILRTAVPYYVAR